MYQLDWAQTRLWKEEKPLKPGDGSSFDRSRVESVSLLHWQEHCLECAPPHCYASCLLFIPRADQKCARLAYGIQANPRFPGLLAYGADVRFRKWAKLTTPFFDASLSPARYAALDAADRLATGAVNALSQALVGLSLKRRLNGAWTVVRNAALRHFPARPATPYDQFVLECFSPEERTFRLVFEYKYSGEVAEFRDVFEIRPGRNFHVLPATEFCSDHPKASVTIYPENDAEVRLVFSWLHFVRLKREALPVPEPALEAETQQPKLKCVAWDLDNTLWTGTLVESEPEKLRLRDGALETVQELIPVPGSSRSRYMSPRALLSWVSATSARKARPSGKATRTR